MSQEATGESSLDLNAILESLHVLPILYLLNFLWFFAAFITFSLNSRGAFLSGTKDVGLSSSSPPGPPLSHLDKANPPVSCYKVRGDLYHYDLLIYLGGMNGAMAVFVLSQFLCQPPLLWRNHETWVALQKLCLSIWGTAHMTQGLVGWGRIRRSGRWRWGGWSGLRTITVVDTLLWVADWSAAYFG